MSRPTITVIIPAYNAARYLGEAVESLRGQTYPAHEIIVVDDGSTDDTPQVLRAYQDSVLAIRQPNGGEAAARNRALVEARGTYVALLDADDVCAPDRFERQVTALLQQPDAIGCFSGYWRFDASRRMEDCPAGAAPRDADSLYFLSRCQFLVGSAMFHRERATGLEFPAGVKSGADMIFAALLATRGRLIALPDLLYGYRSHERQVSIGFRASDTSNIFFESRYQWAKAHWQTHWPERTWEDVEAKLWQGLAAQTEDAYWARHKQFFLKDRNYMRKHWPAYLPKPSVLQWRWYPEWTWQLKSRLDRLVRSA